MVDDKDMNTMRLERQKVMIMVKAVDEVAVVIEAVVAEGEEEKEGDTEENVKRPAMDLQILSAVRTFHHYQAANHPWNLLRHPQERNKAGPTK